MQEPARTSTSAPRAVGWWYLLLLALANLIWSAQGTAVKVLEARDLAARSRSRSCRST